MGLVLTKGMRKVAILVIKTPRGTFLHFTGTEAAGKMSLQKLATEYGPEAIILPFANTQHTQALEAAEKPYQEIALEMTLGPRLYHWLHWLDCGIPETIEVLRIIDRLAGKMAREEAVELIRQNIATGWAICFLQTYWQGD